MHNACATFFSFSCNRDILLIAMKSENSNVNVTLHIGIKKNMSNIMRSSLSKK